ncbi:MAG: cysteine hydrolase [Candidatus Dactylopiibacterium carminicum]|uniref:Cysteine hydrolase n=1 Tax=Candidatus Dactylopiibacterium carminicum TaxID=857335 RepID=A0A272EST4_9RHOO|nr:cysteine hydrolase [Candidatus Dactylopiibacterium carminicum]KAF7599053.1 cysteine hydrolase [Candidatus Dactylopiibacterium carminicum]PAS93096.1 MAG: cysteine hydrolase [Candidatus Dactylopiibacterium carminicum]PAS96661.1 MAG: cysteine hydrolase [Candidatus Dactylopiibacterium carminicum]PAS99066.1 MAG: cysteine hydrolase [Candidatus Dactylopiibacterium carminicum]
MNRVKHHLLIIDPQNDFCDLPATHRPVLGGVCQAPALPVPGAHADMLRLAVLIDTAREAIDAITVTLDSHQHLDIAHPTFWADDHGNAVLPFTQIHAEDVRAGRYRPRLSEALPRVLAYLDVLEASGRYTHMIWPVHCEIGTWGHNIHHELRLALNRWEEAHAAITAKVIKGTNPWTEHYSAVMAEVPDPADAETQLNSALIASLRGAARVFIAGEAGSHCVKATVEHIVANLPTEQLDRLVLIEDCISPVSGFEAHYADFLTRMRELGLQVRHSTGLIDELAGG